MKKVSCFIASLVFFGNIEAQYSERKMLGDFSGIDVSSAARVNLYQSDSNYVLLIYADVIKKTPRVEVHGDILKIDAPFRGSINVYAKNISSIKISDAGRLSCKDTLKTNNLTIHVSDAGRADILVRAKIIKAKANDASHITFSGTADSLDVKSSDASRIEATTLKTGSVRAISSDGSNVSVWAVDRMDANASDGSIIHVKGHPAPKTTSASDGGSIIMDESGDETTQFNGIHRERHVEKDSNWNKGTHFSVDGDAFIGMGFVAGTSQHGAPIRYGRSREFIIGVGYKWKLAKWNCIGVDVYYKSTDFFLAQNSSKSFPDTIRHQAEKISFQNFGGLVFDRFYIGRHLFLDGGIYGDWTFHNKLITWDNNIPNVSSSEVLDKNISFVNPTNYGLTFRFGWKEGVSFYFNYRLSNLFQTPAAPIAAYPELPVYVCGIILENF